MILQVRHPRMKWTVPQLKITQLVTQVYRVYENVDQREISVKT